jgi:hypothetical protein
MKPIVAALGGDGSTVVMRLVAIALLALIGGDLADVSCDPIGIHPQSACFTHPTVPAGDSCGEVCIPDCFCCAHTLPAQSAFVICRAEIRLDPPLMPVFNSDSGFAFVPDHVPISVLQENL